MALLSTLLHFQLFLLVSPILVSVFSYILGFLYFLFLHKCKYYWIKVQNAIALQLLKLWSARNLDPILENGGEILRKAVFVIKVTNRTNHRNVWGIRKIIKLTVIEDWGWEGWRRPIWVTYDLNCVYPLLEQLADVVSKNYYLYHTALHSSFALEHYSCLNDSVVRHGNRFAASAQLDAMEPNASKFVWRGSPVFHLPSNSLRRITLPET